MAAHNNLERILRLMAEKRASDVFLSADMPVLIKVHGQFLQLTQEPLKAAQPRQLLAELVSPAAMAELDESGELNLGLPLAGVGTFRLSAFRQRGSVAAVFRFLPIDIPALDTLALPESLAELALVRRGLVLIVGATGSGKSTTLAALLQHRNLQVSGHILTIEDPIEYLFVNARSVVNQREVGRDVQSLQVGLKNAMRQAPDCIFIGEIRDRETMSAALSYALSGHLVISTLHANNSHHALNRILSFYTPESRPALLSDLASGLKAIVSQRLLRASHGGRTPACEILFNTQLIAEMIEQGNFSGVKEAMASSIAEGSQTFEADLARLVGAGIVTRDEALAHADSATNLLWRLQNGPEPERGRHREPEPEIDHGPSFTEITLDVHGAAPLVAAPRNPARNPALRPIAVPPGRGTGR